MTIKNCRYCGNEFTALYNSQQYCPTCKKEGRNRKPRKVTFRAIPYVCAYCGTKFISDRKKKYCCKECRLRANGRLKEKTKRKKPNKSLAEINELARAMNLSYGQYVARYGNGQG